ncbi:MAG: enoyl-CoA hydratase-related protein [Porticoccaceae bacterium]|nr:enoyl-CoA hydratase-related protein [Porticoccaceae bacterium]
MTTAVVSTSIDSRGVAQVTLNNPAKHNAFDDAIIADLQDAFSTIDRNPDVRLMILAAEGKKGFRPFCKSGSRLI